MSLLDVTDLEVKIGPRAILSDIALQVEEGGIVTILGRNGVGKTTLLRTISGLYRPSKGRIRFDGQDVGGLHPHRIVTSGIAQAPEGRQLFGDMSVAENLRAGVLSVGAEEFRRRLEHIEELFPIIAERRNQSAGSLSGGEQQMVCIGRALMASPRLLLLDEPSLGLAPMIVRSIFEMFATIQAQGVAILLVEQNARLALETAQYAYLIDQGVVVLEGDAERLRSDERVVATYMGE